MLLCWGTNVKLCLPLVEHELYHFRACRLQLKSLAELVELFFMLKRHTVFSW